MNKKFSTLAASLMLASAFSFHAQAADDLLAGVKSGEYVVLKVGENALTVGDQSVLQATTGLDDLLAAVNGATDGTFANMYKALNKALWRVEVVKQTSTTGQLPNLYRFVNKETGEYLALKLKTDTKEYVTDGVAKLDAAGNSLWSAEGGTLSAYVPNATAGKDSTFFLNSALHLASKQGVNKTGAVGISKVDLSDKALALKAVTFNGIMAYNGSNGKLNFNNGKDVTSNETNVLKDTKWKAVQFSAVNTSFALTDGTKKSDGKSDILNDKNEFTTVEKLNYLQVDTTYHNEKDKYFVLVKDTLPYEYTVETSEPTYFGQKAVAKAANKAAARRNADAAEFTGEFFIANDSIALQAVNVPKTLTYSGVVTNPAHLVEYVPQNESSYEKELSDALTEVMALNNVALKEKVLALDGLYRAFIANNNPGRTEEAKFENYAGVEAAISALTATTTSVSQAAATAYVNAAKAASWSAAVITPGNPAGVSANYGTVRGELETDATGKTNVLAKKENIDKAYAKFIAVNDWKDLEHDLTFVAAKFNSSSEYAVDNESGNVSGQDLLDAFTEAANTDSYTDGNGKLAAYKALFTGLKIEKATIGTPSRLTASDNYATAQAAVIEAATNADLLEAIGQLDEDYEKMKELDPAAEAYTGKTFAQLYENDVNAVAVPEGCTALANYKTKIGNVNFTQNTIGEMPSEHFTDGVNPLGTEPADNGRIVLRKLGSSTVLTLANDADDDDAEELVEAGYIVPMIQPYATAGGDATGIVTNAKVYNLQVKNVGNHSALRATNKQTDQYLVATSATAAALAENVDASNVYAQWAFIPGTAGYYTIQNRATKYVYYAGPVSIVKDADGKSVADTYVLGADTLKIAGVTLNEDNFVTENKVQYDYSGTYYTGKLDGITQSYTINPVSPFLSTLSAQMNKDSVMVLGDAEDGLVWHIAKKGDPVTYGLEIAGLPQLKKEVYNIYTIDGEDNEYYIEQDAENDVYILKHKETKDANPAEFEIRNVAEGQYNFIEIGAGGNAVKKMTINATPAKPIIEASEVTTEKNDLFALNKTQLNKYRKLTAEDGVLGNAKIYMENEPNRYLYENTANIVANNGNKIAKDSLNFLGIYNTAAMEKNAALFVDTAYVEREGVYMPQYMFALNVTNVPAHEAIACTYEHNHFDNAGNKVDALHCSHATPATLGYKSGRYLVALTDSIEGVSKHPGRYDGETRLAFVEAIHRNAEDSLIIKNSKWTGNSKQIVAGKEDTYASYDTLKIEDNKLKTMTFALEIADQSTQSFYLATSGNKYVRILNGVPVLTSKKDDAAIFNIEATTEEATANEAIEASAVQVIAGKGVVTVQGAAGKVVTVANILGQTIANQVAASDNVTIAAPAGVLVVTVDGEATKVVVK